MQPMSCNSLNSQLVDNVLFHEDIGPQRRVDCETQTYPNFFDDINFFSEDIGPRREVDYET